MAESKPNVVGWFEIPVLDIQRAIKFYQDVFEYEISYRNLGELEMGLFPFTNEPGAPGSLVKHSSFYKPSTDGVLIYFTSPSGDLKNELSRVEAAGGKIMMDKKLISEDVGYMGLFTDTEGNRIAIHSKK